MGKDVNQKYIFFYDTMFTVVLKNVTRSFFFFCFFDIFET